MFKTGSQSRNKKARKSFILSLHLQPVISRGAESRIEIMDKLSIPVGDYNNHAFGLKDKKEETSVKGRPPSQCQGGT